MSQEQDAPTALPEALEKLADRRLVKTGFDDVRTARRWLGFGELKGVELEPLLGQLEQTGCPDAAVRCLVRLIEAEPRAAASAVALACAPTSAATVPATAAALRTAAA